MSLIFMTCLFVIRITHMYKVNNVFSRWKLQRVLSLLSFAPSLYTCYRRVIFTHRAIHSRLTTGDVTPLVPSVLFLSLFFSPSFSLPFPLSRDAGIPSLCVPRVEERWSFLSPGRMDRQLQGRSLRVFQIVVLHDGQLPIDVLVLPAISEERARKGTDKRREESRVDVILDDKKSHNYSTLRRQYLRSKCGTRASIRNSANNKVY